MAKYDVKHICGHEQEHQLFGKMSDRYRKIAYLETQVCDKCAAVERAKYNAEQAAKNAEAGLVALTGSEKQIAWAESIRAAAIPVIEAYAAEALSNRSKWSLPENVVAEAYALLDKILAGVVQSTSAPWWIDHRDCFAKRDSVAYYVQAETQKRMESEAPLYYAAIMAKKQAAK